MFNPTKPVAKGLRSTYSSRPTVVTLISIAGVGGESLLMVLPPKAELQGWILPQGEILIQESPYDAALRILSAEHGLKSGLFQNFGPAALAETTIASRKPNNPAKHLLVIGLKCRAWVAPPPSDQGKFFLAGGPNAAWEHFASCRSEKQSLFVMALAAALRHKNERGLLAPLLNGPRWRSERLNPLLVTLAS